MTINLKTWDDVAYWVDQTKLCIPASYLDRVNKREYPVDAFSLGQLASKAWLLQELSGIPNVPKQGTWVLLGCWIGSMVPFLHRDFDIKRLYGFDLDPVSVELSEKFNQQLVVDDWKYKGVVADVTIMDWSNPEFVLNGTLIDCKPDVLINTSCEHMSADWFETADRDQLIVMQTNDSPDFEGHVNTCQDEYQMHEKYPLSKLLYTGSLKTPFYTRLMQIGYK